MIIQSNKRYHLAIMVLIPIMLVTSSLGKYDTRPLCYLSSRDVKVKFFDEYTELLIRFLGFYQNEERLCKRIKCGNEVSRKVCPIKCGNYIQGK